MTSPGIWIQGARPKTLPAAVVPVAVGTAVVFGSVDDQVVWWRATAALLVSLALQIGTNYVNDYADGERGTDDDRQGPTRLVGAKLASARQVKIAAAASFGLAAVVGAALAFAVGPELFVVGALSIAAGWAYTGGPKPYGYYGLGEIFVFVFFGLVATIGSVYVHTEKVSLLSILVSIPVGILAVCLLVVNNLRDIPGDQVSGKKTLAVRIGDSNSRGLYVALIAAVGIGIVLCGLVRTPALLGLVGLGLAIGPVRQVLGGAAGTALIPTLGATGKVQLVSGMFLALGLSLGDLAI